MLNDPSSIEKLRWIMSELRDPENGCPWDIKQTFESIIPYTIEEAYEVADAILQGNMAEIKDELADLLFQVVFYAELGNEQGAFDFDAICQHLNEKLIRRHPHVFDKRVDYNAKDLSKLWDSIKLKERINKGLADDSSILAKIPSGITPLLKAQKIQRQCAKVGFDWSEIGPVVGKVQEEIAEVLAELNAPNIDQVALEEEIGDLLFATVNLARHCQVDAEKAMIKANLKFESRFRKVELCLAQTGKKLQDCSIEQMEDAWKKVKIEEKHSG